MANSFRKRALTSVTALTFTLFAAMAGCADGRFSLDSEGNVEVDWSVKGGQLTLGAWKKLAEATGGLTYESKASTDMPDLVEKAMRTGVTAGATVDIAFVVDTTGSMGDDIGAVKERLGEIVDGLAAVNPDWQVGVVAYRDKGDEFIGKTFQGLTNDKASVQAAIDALMVAGGGDYCEHVYEGLDTALTELAWREKAERRIILIGDAPPHDYAGDPATFESVTALATAPEKPIQIHAIGVYCDEVCQALVAVLGGGSCD